MLKFIAKILGTKSEKDIKKLMPVVAQINKEYDEFNGISDDELRGKTASVINTINAELKPIDDQITALNEKVDTNPELDINEKEAVFNEIDKLDEDRN